MRFTLCKLFLIVTMAALASAGMTLHTRLWAEAIVSFSIVLYVAVAILAFRRGWSSPGISHRLRRGRRRLLAARALQHVHADPRLADYQSCAGAGGKGTAGLLHVRHPTCKQLRTTTPYLYSGPINLACKTIPGLEVPDNQFGSPLLTPSVPAGCLPHHRPLLVVVVAGPRGRLLRRVRVSAACTGGRLIDEAHRPSRYTMPANSVGGRFPKHGKRTAAVREPTAPAETARPALSPKRHPPRCTGRDRAARRPGA